MDPQQIKDKVLEFKWERWLERPFGGFVLSLFIGGNSRSAMKKIGVDVEHVASVYEKGAWYQSQEVYALAAQDIEKEVSQGFSIKTVSEDCERYRDEKRERIRSLIEDNSLGITDKLRELAEILKIVTTYIWFAHDFEHYLTPILKREVAKHFEGDIDRLVGDLSFPEKKNAHNYFEEELGRGTAPQELIRKYGWLKGRDPFVEPYTIAELERMRNNLGAEEKQTMRDDVQVPKALKFLVSEARELVYFRTLRTDVFYELLYVARPLLDEVAAKHGLSYHDLKNYSVYDLLNGQLVKYPKGVTCAYFKDDAAYFAEPILPEEKVAHDEIKGVVVYRGKVAGAAKVVLKIEDLGKVKDGDILITPMTTPAYITAMKKAAAFVTNEGGITCHAAIIAREMQKPCIVGTKIATQVIKDGDVVEVDADNGFVRVINLR